MRKANVNSEQAFARILEYYELVLFGSDLPVYFFLPLLLTS